METKMITIPFDIEKAKRIQAGVEEGKIVSGDGYDARIICWDRKGPDQPLIALIMHTKIEYIRAYTNKGCFDSDNTTSPFDLSLVVPSQYKEDDVLKYKEGDILKTFDGSVFIFKEISKGACKYYAAYKNESITFSILQNNYWTSQSNVIGYASEDDKQKFIEALKKHNDLKSFKCLKNFFGIQYCFEPFQKVLVRLEEGDVWEASLFSNLYNSKDMPFCTVGGITYAQCIPYNEETKHLIGTDGNLEF